MSLLPLHVTNSGITPVETPFNPGKIDSENLKGKYLFTHCVELRKLDCILREGCLRTIQINELATQILGIRKDSEPSELDKGTLDVLEGARLVSRGEEVDEEHPFHQYFRRESKIFLGLADADTLQTSTFLRVNQMWRTYGAMIVYEPDILMDRADYLMSEGQANCPFDPASDFLPGQATEYIESLASYYPAKDFYLSSEVKLKEPIANQKIAVVYVNKLEQDSFLKTYADKIVRVTESLFKLKVEETQNGSHFAALKFIPFVPSWKMKAADSVS